MNKLKTFKWWVSPKLPEQYVFVDPEKRPKNPLALGRLYLARWLIHPIRRHITHRYSKLLESNGCEIIGITGSAGKTTAKEMIAAILSTKYKTKWSFANIDPVYNIPATILKTPISTEKLILEMGVEIPGDMDFYLWLVRPKTAIVTTIYWAHTQFFGNLKGVSREKGKLVASLPRQGHAILNYDDPEVRKLSKRTKAKIIWYGTSEKCAVRATGIKITDKLDTTFTLTANGESVKVTLRLLGAHFASVALAAASVGLVEGLTLRQIKQGLEKVESQLHRMLPIKLRNQVVVIDDSYNANPLASFEAIKTLSTIAKRKRKILVFGEMKELGTYEKTAHRQVGLYAYSMGVDLVFGLGDLTKYTIESFQKNGGIKQNTFQTMDKNELIKKLKSQIQAGDTILVKGSRSMAMEDVVAALR